MPGISELSGIVCPLATPLTDERRIDEAGLRRLVGRVMDGGVRAVFVMGSTGEFPAFSREERRFAIETVVDEVAGRLPVLAGVSDSGTELAARNARDAEAAGADAVVATLPYYFPPYSDRAALDHFRHIAGSTSLPLIIYNIPQLVKGAVAVEAVAALAEDRSAAGIKDSSADFEYFQSLIFRLSDMPHFRILQGSEFHLAASLLMGAHGGVLGIANLAPGLCVQLYEAASGGSPQRIEQARELQRRLTALSRIFQVGESPLGSLKAAMSMLDICSPVTTMPIPVVSDESRRKIRKIVEACGLISAKFEIRNPKWEIGGQQ